MVFVAQEIFPIVTNAKANTSMIMRNIDGNKISFDSL